MDRTETVQRGLRLIRPEHDARFEGRFFERHEAFWPIAPAAKHFADHADWPDVETYGRAFDGEGPVQFERAPARRRRPVGPIVRAELYDAMIVQRRAVSTRPRMWHDYLNALVWATFPRAKLALHTRQHAAIERWIPPGATKLPNARTRELDTLALVDEGGILILRSSLELEDEMHLIFGHALYESLVFGQRAMVARAVVIEDDQPSSSEAPIARADRLLAAMLTDTTKIVSPDELSRHPL